MSESLPQVPGYRMRRVIGHGGMSTVYEARQESLDRIVAVKVMLPEALGDEVGRKRFEDEARTIARLRHPHIVDIYDVGRTQDGLPYYAMPMLTGGHLAQRDLRGDQARVLAVLRALLQALDYAHVRGVVHRDVKAENVLFDDTQRPQLTDFGIALRKGSNPRLTSVGTAVGSTAYMAPEQARGEDVDRRADLYSVGVLAWEMLMGRLPYNAGDALSMALMHAQDAIPRLPPELKHWQSFIDKAMAKKPDQRWSSAQQMLDALDVLERTAGKLITRALPVAPAAAQAAAPVAAATARTGWWWPAIAAGTLAVAALAYLALVSREGAEDAAAPTASAPAEAASSSPALIEPDALPAPQATPGSAVATIPPAEHASDGEVFIANAEQQIAQGRLLSPANANAHDNLLEAWRANPRHPRLPAAINALQSRMGDAAVAALRAGRDAEARQLFERLQGLQVRTGLFPAAAMDSVRTRLRDTVATRVDAAVSAGDAAAARRAMEQARWIGGDARTWKPLQARIDAIPAGQARTRAPAAATPSAGDASRKTVTLLPVTREEFGRFVAATGHATADCGRAGVFSKQTRDWRNPGDKLGESASVVCVSLGDAQAYAQWLSRQRGHRYRLPGAGEVTQAGSAASAGKTVAVWTNLCADTRCARREVRGAGKDRAVDAARGHPDVGINLVRER